MRYSYEIRTTRKGARVIITCTTNGRQETKLFRDALYKGSAKRRASEWAEARMDALRATPLLVLSKRDE